MAAGRGSAAQTSVPPPSNPFVHLQAFEQVLAIHPEWRGKLVLVQVTSAAR